MLYLNHFLKAMTEDGHTDIRSLLMPPCYVYKTMKLPAVLSSLKKARQHLAIVSDEYGGTLGVVSMEDAGADRRRYLGRDRQGGRRSWSARRAVRAGRRYGPHRLRELLGIDENSFEAESETVGGWTVESFGDFPQAGDSFRYADWVFTVLSMDGRRVEKLLAKKDPQTEEE